VYSISTGFQNQLVSTVRCDMSLAKLSREQIEHLLPADRCMVCQKTIADVGGRRLVAQPSRGTTITDRYLTGGWKNFRLCIQLLKGKELYMAFWGEESIFNYEVIQRAISDYQNGTKPWFCQVCGKRTCHICGEMLWRPVISDYVFKDGHVVYCPCLGADPGCWNPKCKRYRPTLGLKNVHWEKG
jgi:hypothetical protein